MEKDGRPAELESSSNLAPSAGPNPPLPLEQRSVQITVAFLGIMAFAAILWTGRNTFRAEPNPGPGEETTSVLLQIDINEAEVREFALLPGVGPVRAQRIIDDRQQNGRFSSIEDLSRVHGIGQKTIDQLAIYCLPVDGPDTQVALAEE